MKHCYIYLNIRPCVRVSHIYPFAHMFAKLVHLLTNRYAYAIIHHMVRPHALVPEVFTMSSPGDTSLRANFFQAVMHTDIQSHLRLIEHV